MLALLPVSGSTEWIISVSSVLTGRELAEWPQLLFASVPADLVFRVIMSKFVEGCTAELFTHIIYVV